MKTTIRQFDVFRNATRTRAELPFLVSVQQKDLDHLATRIVVPLATPHIVGSIASRLNPLFKIGGQTLYLLPQNLAVHPVRLLGAAVDNLEQDRERIIAAVDMLITGV